MWRRCTRVSLVLSDVLVWVVLGWYSGSRYAMPTADGKLLLHYVLDPTFAIPFGRVVTG